MKAKTKEEVLQSLLLRRKVLVSEKKYSIVESEPDNYDLKCDMFIAKDGDKVIGTLRVKKESNCYRIQRMAIDKKYRKIGVGSKLIMSVLKKYKNKKLYLMSPTQSIAFYQRFGFKKTKITQKGKYHTYYKLQNY